MFQVTQLLMFRSVRSSKQSKEVKGNVRGKEDNTRQDSGTYILEQA